MTRTYCELCNSSQLVPFYTLKHVPVRIGVAKKSDTYKFLNLTYVECQTCNNVQISTLPKLSDVYGKNHNTNVIGKTWENHNKKLTRFISKTLSQKNTILEIGDPSAKLASLLMENPSITSWTIVEPNPSSNFSSKVKFVNSFFDKNFTSKKKYDLFVMSHVFEHFIGLHDLLPVIYQLLAPNGRIVISVPNLKKILRDRSMSPAGLNFEHTYYFNKNLLMQLFSNYGFSKKAYQDFQGHSEFFCFEKVQKQRHLKQVRNNDHVRSTIEKIFAEKNRTLSKFNSLIKNKKYDGVFVYGAHIQTQMYASMGLKMKYLTGVLDNDPSKHNAYVYGTKLKVFPVSAITTYTNPLIFCDMGPYTTEIKQQIRQYNSKAKIL